MTYALLTGRSAFDTLTEVLDPSLPPPPPSRFVGGLPEALDELVLALLAKEPGQRIGHADVVAAELAELGAGNGAPPGPAPRPHLYRPTLAGRGQVLQRLGRLLSENLRAGRGALVFLGGESGIGKTRLAVEAASRFRRQGLQVLAGECQPGAAGGPLHPLLGVLRAVADRCREGGPAETARLMGERARVLARYEPALRELFGESSPGDPEELPPDQARLRLFRYLAQTLTAFAAGQPLLLVLDDLHWADDLTLGFVAFAARTGLFERQRLIVLGTYRTEEAGPELQACLDAPPAAVLPLDRLDASAVGVMAADMLGMWPAPELLARSLVRRTDGNPFFVAEYLRLAVQEGLLSRNRRGRWQPAGGASAEAWDALPLPGSVRSLVARRLGALPQDALTLVRCAAVAGREGAVDLLRRLAGLDDALFLDAAAEAVRRQVLEDSGAGLLRFVHDQIREVAYENIPPPERPALHRAAAELLEALPRAERDLHLGELGRHWEHAGEIEQAWSCYVAGARLETGRYAYAEAERLYRAALGLPRQPDDAQVQARCALGLDILSMRGRGEAALAELSRALDDARRLGLPAGEARCLKALGKVHYQGGRLEDARRSYDAALVRYQELSDSVGEADAISAIALVDALQGQLQVAHDRHTRALELYRRLGHQSGIGSALGHLGTVAWQRSDMRLALELLSEALAIDRALGHRRDEALRLNHLGAIDWSQGRLSEGRQLYERALQLQRQIGDRLGEGITLLNLGTNAWTAGDLGEAGELYEQALAIHREIGDRRLEAAAMTNLACVDRDQGRLQRARERFFQALELHRAVGNRLDEEDTLVQMAILGRRAGDALEGVEELLATAENLARGLENSLRLARCLCERGHLALARGGAGRELLEQAERLVAESGAGAQSEYSVLAARLRRAVEASEAGQPLVRGEMAEDLPDGFRRSLEPEPGA